MWAGAAVGVAADQATKWAAETHLRVGEVVSIVPRWVQLRYAPNASGLFGVATALDFTLRRWLLAAVTLMGGVVLAALAWRLVEPRPRVRAAYALLLAGAFGNLVDRVAFGEVIDFVHVAALLGGSFNLADLYIVFGVVLLSVDVLRGGAGPAGSPA
jgi:lipoprotein signal peptidase